MQQGPDHVRRAKRVWFLQSKVSHAKWIAEWVDEKPSRWYHLSASHKILYSSLDDLQRELEEVLRTPAGARYRGSGSDLAELQHNLLRASN